MTFGKRIRELRMKNGLTQRQLAKLIERNFTYISKIENEKLEHTPSVNTITRLSVALDADELELMDLANKLPPIFEDFSGNPDAFRFYQRAVQKIKSPKEWKDLLEYLENLDSD